MTFDEWFRSYPGKDEPDAEKHCRAAWDAKSQAPLLTDSLYIDSRIREMDRQLAEKTAKDISKLRS